MDNNEQSNPKVVNDTATLKGGKSRLKKKKPKANHRIKPDLEVERSYIDCILSNDFLGMNVIYQKFKPRIRNLILLKGGTQDDADDLFQMALIVIYELAKKPDFVLQVSFYGLLRGIVRKIWSNQLKRKDRHNASLDDPRTGFSSIPDVQNIQQLIEQEERMNILHESMKELNENEQSLLKLSFKKVPIKEIARMMGYTERYTSKKICLTKIKLKEVIKRNPVFKELHQK